VCGFTEGKGSRKHLGALLLGAYRNGKLRYFGHSGTGCTEKGLAEAVQRMRPFSQTNQRSRIRRRSLRKSSGCSPSFAEWTEDELLRQTTFLGWRDDKTPEEVVLEVH